MVNGVQFECLNPLTYGVEPNPDEVMNMEFGYGLLTYRNIGHALFSTTKQIFMTGSSRLAVLYRQTIHRLFT